MTKYPVAQIFISLQGEGQHTGILMKFIRLAGCNVGKYSDSEAMPELRVLQDHHPRYSICSTVLGQKFLCDTDYHKIAMLTAEEILKYPRALNARGDLSPDVKHVCITGGEPFLHDLQDLTELILAHGLKIHIETSGTLPIPTAWLHEKGFAEDFWITCSPKEGYLPQNFPLIREFKFLIAENDNPQQVLDKIYALLGGALALDEKPVYVQPVNGILDLNQRNIAATLALQRLDPRLLFSAQLHKYLSVE